VAVYAVWDRFGANRTETVALLGEGIQLGAYTFERYLSQKSEHSIERVLLLGMTGDEQGLAFANAAAQGVCLARDLVNEPPDVCTPTYMADIASELAKEYGFEVKILGPDGIADEKMNLFAAVSRGSEVEARFIHLTYRGSGKIVRRLAYVGKGVTFDTGGYNLKPTASILNMHCDMAGGAAVLGAAKSIGELKPAGVEVHFIVPSAANMVSAGAYTVNEVIRGRGGKTVEINNTDAEGRLLLADAISYATELDVDEIIDLATLTGACVVALGEHTTALFCNDEKVAKGILASALAAGERFWRLPLDEKLHDKLKSSVADMKNTGDRWGGAITAALFLKEWVGDKKWAHLDIAGPAFLDKDTPLGPKGGTGVGVSALALHALRSGKGN
ncbi:MAG: leucyl aminopeptidase, partial [Deltaproteobacteria bacterium]|nr:leucyl aminopeptidase [Deltaproteobacteria bacterium]